MVAWRRDLHQIPELGLELPRTTRYVSGVLSEIGIPHEVILGGNAIVGLIEGRAPGRVIALRSDMDALAVTEETGLSFASANGCMHACGHDGHMAMLLGAALWLWKHKDQFKGSVKLLFQPGEESPGGAKPMIEAGCLENPKVEAVFGMHAGQISNELPEGKIGFKAGPIMAAVDIVNIKVKGKGGHGGYPAAAIDPVPVAAELILALQTLISREKKPGDPAVLSITNVHAGRTMNVIPDEATLEGTVRNTSQETREWLAGRIREMSECVARAHGAEAEIDHNFIYPALINDAEMTRLVRGAAAKVAGEERLYELKEAVMAGEDFSYFAEAVPSCYVFISSMAPIGGKVYPHHASRFDLDEGSFTLGAKLHAQTALDFLASAED